MKKILCAIVFLFPIVMAPATSMGQVFGNLETLEGDVWNIQDDKLTLAQMSNDPMQGPTYLDFFVTQQTDFQRTSSLDSLERGDRVRIKFRTDNPAGDRFAVQIARLPPVDRESREEMPR